MSKWQGVPFVNAPAYYGHGGQRPQEQFKKSGAKYSRIKEGNFKNMTCVNAWNVSKSKGLIKASVMPYHASVKGGSMALVESKKGNQYVKMIARVFYTRTGNEVVIPCLMNVETQVITLNEIGMCISPNGTGRTKSGKTAKGYFGTFVK